MRLHDVSKAMTVQLPPTLQHPASLVITVMVLFVGLTSACKRQIQTTDLKARPDSGSSSPVGPLAPAATHTTASAADMVDQIVSLEDFTFPLPGGQTTSSWCECRPFGTSPHIGLDLAGSNRSSLAVSDGLIESARNTGSCGWEVRLRDANGALWLYLHMNKPFVQAGDRVAKGRVLGDHHMPRNGCITGPHLHLERLSASRAIPGDKPQGNSCRYGYKTCNYNPEIVFQMNRSESASSVALTGGRTTAGGIGPLVEALPSAQPVPKDTHCFRSSPERAATVEVQERLKASPGQYVPPLQLEIRYGQDDTGRSIVRHVATTWLSGSSSKSSALEPLCGTSRGQAGCLSGYTLYVRDRSGTWGLAAEATGLAEDRIVLGDEADQCFVAEISDVRLIVRSRSGKEIVLAP